MLTRTEGPVPRLIWHTGKGIIECSSVVIHRPVSLLFSSVGSYMLKMGQDSRNAMSSTLPPELNLG